MPMDFPDFNSLRNAAAMWEFREPMVDETEDLFRNALADFVADRDIVESMEIRAKVGWNKFSDRDNAEMLLRAMQQPNTPITGLPPEQESPGQPPIVAGAP